MGNKLVSILIPTYNRAHLISDTIKSALDQTYKNIEVIVVDNCSTDDTNLVVMELCKSDQRLRFYQNELNIGPVANWIKAVKLSKGDFCKILWSDDLMEKTYIEKTLPLFNDETIGFVCSAVKVFNENNENTIIFKNLVKNKRAKTIKFIEGILSGNYPLSPGNAIFRTSDLRKNLLLDIPNKINSDFKTHAIGNDALIYLLTSLDYDNFGFINKPLIFFRDHEGSITTSTKKEKLRLLYTIAMSHIVDIRDVNSNLIKKINSRILFVLILYKKNELGLKKISDFYMNNSNFKISYFFFIKICIKNVHKLLN